MGPLGSGSDVLELAPGQSKNFCSRRAGHHCRTTYLSRSSVDVISTLLDILRWILGCGGTPLSFVADFVATQPMHLIAALIFVALLLAEFLGSLMRKWLQKKSGGSGTEASGIEYVLTSVFALLGLLIAFTFSLTLDRYETRRDLVVKEANAIGTAHIRSAFASDLPRMELRALLETYAGKRLEYGNAPLINRTELAKESAELRIKLIGAGISASQSVSIVTMAPSLISSVNDVIDIGSEREAVSLARIPASVVHMLLGYTMISAFLLGYSQLKASTPQQLANKMLFVLLTLALVSIFDLDRPATGAIRVSQQPMAELIASFRN